MSSHQTIAIFSSTWWMSIILTSVIIYFMLKWSNQADLSQQKKMANAVGGILLFIAFFIHIYQVIRGDWNLQTSLPLNLCSLSGLLSGIVLLFPNQDLYEFLLFWGIPGAFHSFITPELTLGNQNWYFYDYYLAHGGIILSVLFLSFIFKFRPRPYSWLKVFGWTQVLLLMVFFIDKGLGANYMYLIEKPLAHNIFIFGIWPWYIIGFEMVGLIHFYIVYLLFRKTKRISNLQNFHKYGMKIALVISSICVFLPALSAQTGLQNIRGEIRDKDSEHLLSYVSIALFRDTTVVQAVQSNEQGKFEFNAIVPGRYFLKTYLVGYKSSEIKDVIVNSGKESIVDIFLDETPQQLSEITIHSSEHNEHVNEMVLAGGKIFSVDETNRYAGSRGDPARMAASFAGTQSTDDSRNDIVIRGNSPLGILWRIQDVDIPNPNHFAIPGTTGGAISILNNKMFRNSDFLIGAFPAEYGNCNAGVFDIKLRNGNNERHEGTAQFGFLGTELALEGPLSKQQNSTYLVTYRYSTLKLFESFNIRIGTDAVPNYQDLSFKINIPLKHDDNLSFFGIGGTSKIDIILSKFDKPTEEIYGENNKDQYFKSSMGLVGATYSKSIKPGLLLKATISHIINFAGENDFTIYRNQDYSVDSLVRSLGYRFKTNKSALALTLQNKIDSRNTLKAGIHVDLLYHDLVDSTYKPNTYSFLNRMDDAGYTSLWQGYAQWKFKWNPQLEMNSGIHLQYSALNKQIVIEPRFSIQWKVNEQNSFSFGTGLHSQLQPYYIYFYKATNTQGRVEEQNKNLGFSKSFHTTLGYELSLSDHLRLKLETYYIRLFDIPVNAISKTSYSVVNEGGEFGRFFPGKLENSGTGYNDGIEGTLEKTFSSGYYFLFNASLFESKYKGSDGVLRNTAYNANFTMNALMGKELPMGRNHNKVLSLGSKVSFAGGRRYSPADLALSKLNGELVIQDAYRNDLQFKNYFRLDMKLGYKINTKTLTHEFGIDLVNVLGTKNILSLVYAPDPRNANDNPIKQENQLGFLPLFYYKLDFAVKK